MTNGDVRSQGLRPDVHKKSMPVTRKHFKALHHRFGRNGRVDGITALRRPYLGKKRSRSRANLNLTKRSGGRVEVDGAATAAFPETVKTSVFRRELGERQALTIHSEASLTEIYFPNATIASEMRFSGTRGKLEKTRSYGSTPLACENAAAARARASST